jgi:hypothetical protein
MWEISSSSTTYVHLNPCTMKSLCWYDHLPAKWHHIPIMATLMPLPLSDLCSSIIGNWLMVTIRPVAATLPVGLFCGFNSDLGIHGLAGARRRFESSRSYSQRSSAQCKRSDESDATGDIFAVQKIGSLVSAMHKYEEGNASCGRCSRLMFLSRARHFSLPPFLPAKRKSLHSTFRYMRINRSTLSCLCFLTPTPSQALSSSDTSTLTLFICA